MLNKYLIYLAGGIVLSIIFMFIDKTTKKLSNKKRTLIRICLYIITIIILSYIYYLILD